MDGHVTQSRMRNQEPEPGNSRHFFLVLFGVALDMAVAVEAMEGANDWVFPTWRGPMAHVVACAVLVVGLSGMAPASLRVQRGWVVAFLFGLSLVMPGMGPLLAIAIIWSLRRVHPPEDRSRAYHLGLDELRWQETAGKTSEDIRASIMEMLSKSSAESRRKAVLALRGLKPENAIPILLKAMRDTDEHVRIYAQGLLEKIIASIENALKRMEQEIEQGKQSPKKLAAMAERYHEMVYLGLVATGNQQTYLDHAIVLMRWAVEVDPHNQTLWFGLLKYALKNQRHDIVQEALAHLKELKYSPEQVTPWELELYFQKREWQAFHDTLETLAKNPLSPVMQNVKSFWFQSPSLGTRGMV